MSVDVFIGLALVLVCVLLAWHLTYTAARLDRLHARVEGSLAALDAQLVRRGEVSLELANAGALDPASAYLLASAAALSLADAEDALITDDVQVHGISPERAQTESELTDALDAVLAEYVAQDDAQVELRRRLIDACQRVEVARRFHNEAVLDVRRVREKFEVRAFHLAGHTHLPETVEFDSSVEAAN